MKAFKVRVMLYEGKKSCDHSIWFLTIAADVAAASSYVEKAVTKADETEAEFSWQAVEVVAIEDQIAMPATKEIKPRMVDDQ